MQSNQSESAFLAGGSNLDTTYYGAQYPNATHAAPVPYNAPQVPYTRPAAAYTHPAAVYAHPAVAYAPLDHPHNDWRAKQGFWPGDTPMTSGSEDHGRGHFVHSDSGHASLLAPYQYYYRDL